ncbi:23S rRNA (uracil(747)-C(5))-methyltransferase RlmC [Vibrio sp.]|uniref:23S rRNA (uracil(747)-C(5))-methyltransferase RlmC n=1 Tax=Vibrio viridaestus TaxID=2487322 RepID=A0A3N9TDE7_9VIBR|nr:23S rRNA (uracil(747)-C(5))-methyltransferase RlmC [Vibrio viridaestus]MDC0611013.1 23S rRNA (uracil(747)-C(5))-methyltransferase RlmC [Vibrio sp.]RQW62080.1 23S rRNA (uracil(747)-C(5))-methyltransferase RlmC [Vibrio viridaestus]
MFCAYHANAQCHSCEHIDCSYPEQINQKQTRLKRQLNISDKQLLPLITSAETRCRNKAKMVVLGVAQSPILGIESVSSGEPVSLGECALYTQSLQDLITALPAWMQNSGLVPYNKIKRKGELKYILITESTANQDVMIRFIMHSENQLNRITNNLPLLLSTFPKVKVVTVNIQPVHMARLEGEKEIFLTEQHEIVEILNEIPLSIRPKSFFQTNSRVAEQLYKTVAKWVKESNVENIWDLFCGVGGFALHCAPYVKSVTGIEIEPEAIRSAQHSAKLIGINNIEFAALDSRQFSESSENKPDLIIVNPPRRGLGKDLVEILNRISPKKIIYSSCNPDTLIKDLELLDYTLVRAQGFDMFPHTPHLEAAVELIKKPV